MSLFKESFKTLQLFTIVFVIGGGILGLWDIYQYTVRGEFHPFWDPFNGILSAAYVIGGIYFVKNIRAILPIYRAQVVKVIIGMFLVNVVIACLDLIMMYRNPSLVDPEVANDPELMVWILFGVVFNFLFSFLVYAVMIHAVNTVSGLQRTKPHMAITVAAWAIILFLVAGVMIYGLAPN